MSRAGLVEPSIAVEDRWIWTRVPSFWLSLFVESWGPDQTLRLTAKRTYSARGIADRMAIREREENLACFHEKTT
jgi:hypothetical protein